MNNIRDIQEESVRQLATTLKASGLAASETEAIRMAMSMSHTNNKVTQNFEDRKDRNTMGLSYLDKETKDQKDVRLAKEAKQEEYRIQQDKSVDIPKTAAQIVEEQMNAAKNINTQKAVFNQGVETYEEDIDLSNVTLEEASKGYTSEHDNQNTEFSQPSEEPKTEIVAEMEEEITIEFKDDEEFIVQDVVKSETVEIVPKEEPKPAVQEQPQSSVQNPVQPTAVNTPERKPKKDISQMAESKVDLGSVFNFNKR